MLRLHPLLSIILASALVAGCGGDRIPAEPEVLPQEPSPPVSEPEMEPEPFPLLGQARGGSVWSNFCDDQPDDAVLPTDPRTRVVPGVNQDRAVVFNAYWTDCDNGVERPTTCGELREQAELGGFVALGQGEIGTPITFAGGQDVPSGFDAALYNRLWQLWGMSERPDNFDQLVAERYGSPSSVSRNPYPLPGEDPNQTDGGSGQLPLVLTQIREPDGTWTGEIGHKFCLSCHAGQVGTPEDGPGMGVQVGGAGTIGDFSVMLSEFAQMEQPLLRDLPLPGLASLTTPAAQDAITLSTQRGTGAIDFLQLFYIVFSGGDPELLLNEKIVASGAIGNIKSPPWWNMAYRPQKFHGAVFPMDASRISMAAYYDLIKGLSGGEEDVLAWLDAHGGPFHVWAESLHSPQYPFPIDEDLARQGAILFHEKDLWSENLNNPHPRPAAGNGSCASCHGVYSPRYANDDRFLESPDLMGVAAHVLPLTVIGTDPKYAESFQSHRRSDGSLPPATEKQTLAYCGTGAALSEGMEPVMLSPPLWGAWASAPYFHNGSVPNLWGVLDPHSERPAIWKRASAPARSDQEGKVIMGFDTDLHRAYDHERLGWHYQELQCGDPGTQPLLNCNPINPAEQSTLQRVLSVIYDNVGLAWNLPRLEQVLMTDQVIEDRKIYNTQLYSQGNQGHAFTEVLSDLERRALIEYMKTL